MARWAASKNEPGKFTGTATKILTPDQLQSGYQAWARKVRRDEPFTMINSDSIACQKMLPVKNRYTIYTQLDVLMGIL